MDSPGRLREPRACHASALTACMLAIGVAVTSSAGAQTPKANPKEQCLASFEQSQRLRAQAKLREALAETIVCGQEACPSFLRDRCLQWMTDIRASIPTVVVGVRDAQGRDLTDAQVMVDGELTGDGKLGSAWELNPGRHVFRIGLKGRVVAEREVLIRQGEKDRLLDFTPDQAQTAPPTSADASFHEPASTTRSSAGWIVGGVGIAALLVGGYFGVRTLSRWSDRKAHCPADMCDDEAVKASQDAHTAAWIANLSIGLGLVGVGAGAYLLGTARTSDSGHGPATSLTGFSLGMGGRW